MLQKLITVLILLWLLGVVTSFTIGGFLHLFLILAIILVGVSFYQGQKIQWPPWKISK